MKIKWGGVGVVSRMMMIIIIIIIIIINTV